MFKLNPMMLGDFYKMSHPDLYDRESGTIYATWTPRKSRIEGCNKVVVFGVQAFIQKWLIEYFEENFFKQDVDKIVNNYLRLMNNTIHSNGIGEKRIRDLHKLGYLPLEIRCLPEGTMCPIGVPMLTIENTKPEFYWITNFIESFMSSELWSGMTSATIAHKYKKILNHWADKTCDNRDHVDFQGHDFSFRGLNTVNASLATSAGHLLSFSGTDTVPAIPWLEYYYGANVEKEMVATSIPACYDDKTEILTDSGWKLFKDLEKGKDKVAQYHKDGTIDFVLPLDYFKDYYKGQLIHFSVGKSNYIDITVTPNHRMVRKNTKNGNISFIVANGNKYNERVGYSNRYSYIVAGNVIGEKNFTALDKLRIAFQADGSLPSHHEDYTGIKNNGYPIRFSFKKERKANRLRQICNELGIKYTESYYEHNGYYSFWVVSPVSMTKDFSWIDLKNISLNYCRQFIEELQYWDGKTCGKNCISYSSIIKSCVDMVQIVSTLAGYKSKYYKYIDKRENRQALHTLQIDLHKNCIGGANTHKEKVNYDGYVYCVSVPTKMIVVRRNNVVLICGNTEHSIMEFNSAGKENDEYEAFKRIITEVHPTGIVSVVSDTWNLWEVLKNVLPRLKSDILLRDGKIVIRPDAGNPCDIVCGVNTRLEQTEFLTEYKNAKDKDYLDEVYLGVVEILWNIFGGTINSKGYKVLDPHIGCIYGDAITMERANEICERLAKKGFASSNIVFGIGSYTYQYNTRDTFGFALKSTYAVKDGKEVFLFKDPITDSGEKKSQKGMVAVIPDGDTIKLVDHLTSKDRDELADKDLLQLVFKDGTPYNPTTLSEIRDRLLNQTSQKELISTL